MEVKTLENSALFPVSSKLSNQKSINWVVTTVLKKNKKSAARKRQPIVTSLTTVRLTLSLDWNCFKIEISSKFLATDEPKRSIVLWSSPKTRKGGPGCYEITAHSPTSGREIPGTKYIGMSMRPVFTRNKEELIAAARGYGSQKFFSEAVRQLAKQGCLFRSHQIANMPDAARSEVLDAENSFINWEIIFERSKLLNRALPVESKSFLKGELTPPRQLSISYLALPPIAPGAPDNNRSKISEASASRFETSKVRKRLDFSSCKEPAAPEPKELVEEEWDKLFSSPVLDWAELF